MTDNEDSDDDTEEEKKTASAGTGTALRKNLCASNLPSSSFIDRRRAKVLSKQAPSNSFEADIPFNPHGNELLPAARISSPASPPTTS